MCEPLSRTKKTLEILTVSPIITLQFNKYLTRTFFYFF
jgi:hypothetical protein